MLITIIYSAIYIYSLFLSNINLFCKIIMPSYTSYFINILLSTILHIRIHIYIHTHSLCEHIGSKKKCPIGKKKDKERERERERDSVEIFSRYTVCYPPIVFYFPAS